MGMSVASNLSGKKWWIDKIMSNGCRQYPKHIVVGDPTKGRIYVPERTCHQVMPPWEPGVEEIPVCSACGRQLFLEDDEQYCPGCGAKVVCE